MTAAPLRRLRALDAVLAAAREALTPCSSGGHVGAPPCDQPAVYTLGSPNVTLCRGHARAHEGRRDLWPLERQARLVAAIEAYDALEDSLADDAAGDETGEA